MATMNKPALGDVNWYQALTDNWTSIEANLLDKSIVTTKGDILAATGAGAPARLAAGSNGQYLVADSAQSAGVKWETPAAMSTQEAIDILWGKRFFEETGYLPSTKIFEYLGTPPAFAGTAGGASWTRDPGVARASASGIAWYDLGASKSKVLLVVGNALRQNYGCRIHLTPSAPSGLDPDGYSIDITDACRPSSHASGTYSVIDGSYYSNGGVYQNWNVSYALYVDGSSGLVQVFFRFGTQWYAGPVGTDTAYATLRYVALQSGDPDECFITPFVCYAQ